MKKKFLQQVKTTFSSSSFPSVSDLQNLQSVYSVKQTNKRTFEIKVKGNINEILKWLPKYEVERITIEDTSLEDIFLAYYE
ncbi:MAG: ATP-binding protein DrrA1-3 family domain-containing protein [Candidatus Hodarchaeales archaeon]